MSPIVTEVENVYELLCRLETSKFDDAAVLDGFAILPLRIRRPDTGAVGKLELMEM